MCPINAKPPRYVFDNLIAAAAWLVRALDVQGVRVDDVKGLSTDFLLPFEVASVVLLAALVGSVIIARKEIKEDSDAVLE